MTHNLPSGTRDIDIDRAAQDDKFEPPYHCAVFIGRGKMYYADMGLRQCRECGEEEKRK